VVALSEAKASLKDWDLRLTQVHIFLLSKVSVYTEVFFSFQLKIERKSGDSAVLAMTQNVTTRLDVRSRKSRYTIVKNVFGHANGFKMTSRMGCSGK
jgi:transcription initiation factor TFIIH subunit 1